MKKKTQKTLPVAKKKKLGSITKKRTSTQKSASKPARTKKIVATKAKSPVKKVKKTAPQKEIPTKVITAKKVMTPKEVAPKKGATQAIEALPVKPTKAARTTSIKAPSKTKPKVPSLDLKQELSDELIERGKRMTYLTYEELMAFSEKNHISEVEMNEILRLLEKEHVDLIMQDELEQDGVLLDKHEDDEAPHSELKSKLESSLDLSTDQFEEEEFGDENEDEREVIREIGASQITDPVKCYLRDIGKIPLLNKKTEGVIADQIALSKKNSIDALSRFPVIHKEFLTIGEKVQQNVLPIKDVIQFSEFDEENAQMSKKKRKHFLSR